MDVIPVSQEQVLSFISTMLVPAVVDVVRVGAYQIALRLKQQKLSQVIAGSKFGLFTTMFASLLFGVLLYAWFGQGDITLQGITQNSLIILGWSQLVYKGVYEKSELRKSIVSVVDKIGVQDQDKTENDLGTSDVATQTQPESVG